MTFKVINRLITGNTEYGSFSTLAKARKAIKESGNTETKFIVKVNAKGETLFVE